MKKIMIFTFILLLPLAVFAERWEFNSLVGDTIQDPIYGQNDTFFVDDSIFVPIHAFITDINFFVGIQAWADADKIDVIVYSPSNLTVYLSHYNHYYPRRYFFDIWFDTQDSIDGPGNLNDYVGLDVYGWWKMRSYSISHNGPDAYWREWRIEVYGTTTGIIETIPEMPADYFLEAAYPNPFNLSTLVKFGLPQASWVKLDMFDILGRKATTLIDGQMPAGYHNVAFDASDFASGVYFCRLSAGDKLFVQRMTLIK